jgi:hypothetical protein
MGEAANYNVRLCIVRALSLQDEGSCNGCSRFIEEFLHLNDYLN